MLFRSGYVELRGKLAEANQQESLASQKLEALRVLQEQQADATPGPAARPPVAIPANVPAAGPAFDIDALPVDSKAKLESITQGLDPDRMRDLVSVIFGMAAEFGARQPEDVLPTVEAGVAKEAEQTVAVEHALGEQPEQQAPQQQQPQQQVAAPAEEPPVEVPVPDFGVQQAGSYQT